MNTPKRNIEIQLVLDSSPPHLPDVEEALLGAILLRGELMDDIGPKVMAETFYIEKHRIIYAACLKLWTDSRHIDIVTVTEQVRKSGQIDLAGGPYGITTITNRAAGLYHGRVIEYALLLLEKYGLRELSQIALRAHAAATDDQASFFDLIDQAESDVQQVRSVFTKAENKTIEVRRATDEVIEGILTRKSGELTGIPTGHEKIDIASSGWQPGDLIIFAARPGMGKTAQMIARALAAARAGYPVPMFSLEMTTKQLITRFLISMAGIDNESVKSNRLSEDEVYRLRMAKQELDTLPIFINDSSSTNVFDIRTVCRGLKKKYDNRLGPVFVDYLQLMSSHFNSVKMTRDTELSMISRGLKGVAKELDVPIIAFCQVARAAEDMKDKRPRLKHLRESGAIEQDADIVIFLYRPSYYYQYEERADDPYYGKNEQGISEKEYEERAELEFAKFRNGRPNTVFHEKFCGSLMKFYTGVLEIPYTQQQKLDDIPW